MTLQCVDQPGIVHSLTSAILNCKGNIIENQEFTDPTTSQFSPVLEIKPESQKRGALILVTKESHCLRDILFLLELGELPIEIPLVMSNHEELRSLVESHGITFTSMVGIGKPAQEAAIKNEINSTILSCQVSKAQSLITKLMLVA